MLNSVFCVLTTVNLLLPAPVQLWEGQRGCREEGGNLFEMGAGLGSVGFVGSGLQSPRPWNLSPPGNFLPLLPTPGFSPSRVQSLACKDYILMGQQDGMLGLGPGQENPGVHEGGVSLQSLQPLLRSQVVPPPSSYLTPILLFTCSICPKMPRRSPPFLQPHTHLQVSGQKPG